jgi:DNA-binding protein YbaB
VVTSPNPFDGALSRLQELNERGSRIFARLTETMNRAPEITLGTDSTGTVRVQVDKQGMAETIEVTDRWAEDVGPDKLEAAITEAAGSASVAYAEAMRAIQAQVASESAPTVPTHPAPPASQSAEPSVIRPDVDIVEDVIAFADATDDVSVESVSPEAEQTVDWGGPAPVQLEVVGGALRGCTINANWAARQNIRALNRALGDALEAARADAPQQGSPVATDPRSRRAAELLTELTRALERASGTRAQEAGL